MTLSLRPATVADIDLLEAWGRELYDLERTFEPGMRYSGEAFRERDMEALSSPDAHYLIAEIEGRAVGYIAAMLGEMPEYLAMPGRECVIEVVFVEEDARGRGVGTALLEACLGWAKKQGAKRVRAGVYARNRASLELFERVGLHAHHVTVLTTLE